MEILLNNMKYIVTNKTNDVFLVTDKNDLKNIKDCIDEYFIGEFLINRLLNHCKSYYSQVKVKLDNFVLTILQIWKKETVAYLPNITTYECEIKNKKVRCKNVYDGFETFDNFIEIIFEKEHIFLSKQIKSSMKESFINKTNNTFTKISDAYYFEVRLFF